MSHICECGALTELETLCLVFTEEDCEDKKAHLCEKCFREKELWCERHGPKVMIDSPELREMVGCEPDDRDVMVGYCLLCVLEEIESLGKESIDEYAYFLTSEGDGEILDFLLNWSEGFLPEELSEEERVIGGCIFISNLWECEIKDTISYMVAPRPLDSSLH